MEINIKVIPNSKQRYSTCGDWWWTPAGLEVRVSQLGDEYKELCIAIHEVCEAFLCRKRGISQEQVDRFDKDFEKQREIGNTDEPGDHPRAPYKREHCFATGIERLLVSEFDIDWSVYEEIINSL